MSRKRMVVCFCALFIVLVGCGAGFYFVAQGSQRRPNNNNPSYQEPGKNATIGGMMPMK
jgi:hypothetical protein